MTSYKNGHYYSLNEYLQNTFGCKVYKLSINGGFTCPNRDGKIDSRGCIFCSAGGSGEFSQDKSKSISQQIELAKNLVKNKISDGKYIAYFQAFTNTYAPVSYLKKIFTEAITHKDIAALSIATRPDCLPEDVLELLSELNRIKPVWVELGLQTIHQSTADYIRRGYSLDTYDKAVSDLRCRDINTITHIIIGLPNETKSMMLDTVKYVCDKNINGIKLQLLHVLKNTDLMNDYENGYFKVLSLDEYLDIICDCIEIIPKDIVIHRLTGDGDKKLLAAPLWSGNKKAVLNAINRTMNERNIIQGSKYLF